MNQKFSISATLLAGGKSSRMGQDKALLPFRGKTLLENLVQFVSPLFREVLVVVDKKEKLKGLDMSRVRICEDFIRDSGPMAGIYTGLAYTEYEASCVLSCDMPFLDESLIHFLVKSWEKYRKKGVDVICFENRMGQYQPFPAIYRRSSRWTLYTLLEQKILSMKSFFERVPVQSLMWPEQKKNGLINMNTPEDYQSCLKVGD